MSPPVIDITAWARLWVQQMIAIQRQADRVAHL